MTLFDELGGTAGREWVHRIFYGKLLAHPWLRGFFHGKDRDHLESQQTDFMTGMFGGPKCYFGRAVGCAHIHLFISDEVFTLRHGLLADSLAEAGVPATLAEKPVVLTFGRLDPSLGADEVIERWQETFTNTTYVDLPRASHYIQEDAPEEMIAAIRAAFG